MTLSGTTCIFCAAGTFYNAGACTTCDATCNSMCEGSATGCTKCLTTEILDLSTKTCGTTCAGTTIVIDTFSYCRSNKIYVDSTSTSTTELGTLADPYKTIDQAFIEIFNYWPAADPVDVMVKEGTDNKIYFQERPLIVNRKDNVQIMTYTAGGAASLVNANLTVTNTEIYAPMWSTRYSLMAGKNYDYVGAGSTITTVEKSRIDTLWYTFIILQANFKIDRFLIDNVLKLEDDDFAIVHPISNIAPKTLTINNCVFINYGTAMFTTTSISFSSLNVEIQTPRLVGGFVFLVSCDPLVDVVTGEVVIDGLNFHGARSVLFKYGGIYMTGTQNFTIQNSFFGSYGFMFDAKQLTRADSPLNCKPTDNAQQIIRLHNNEYNMAAVYSGTPHHGFICSFLSWYPRTNMLVYFTNNTMTNIRRSFYRILLLDVSSAIVYVDDNIFKDSTGAVDISQIDTTKDVFIRNNLFQNISSTSQNIMVVASSSNVIIDNFTMNGANPDQVSSAVINLNMATDAVATLTNIKFTNNLFAGTKAIVSQQLLSLFTMTNSLFTGDKIMQNTNYIDIQQATKVTITDTNFTGITYQNVDDSGAYLIYIAKEKSDITAADSVIERVIFSNIKTNAISFGGFEDAVAGGGGNLYIRDVDFKDSIFSSPDSLIATKKFSYTGLSKMIITNTRFSLLEFTTFGNLLHLTHNAAQPFEITSVIFNEVYGAGILLEPQDIFDKTNPLTLNINTSTFTSNTPWVAGFINVFENSKVNIDNSTFTNTSSAGSGSVVLANYKENLVIINDCNFTNNYAILGGVFYSQFSSVIQCNNCTFVNNIAIRGGVSFLNSNGNIWLNGCDLTQNQALNAPALYISACQAAFSVVSNTKIYLNDVITMDALLNGTAPRTAHIRPQFIQEVLNNRVFYEKSVSGSKKSAISMIKGKLRVNSNTTIFDQINFLGTFESEIEIIDTLFENITLATNNIIFHLLSSTFTYTNSTMNLINCTSRNEAMFQVRLESIFRTRGSNAKITNSNCQFAFLLYSTAEIYDILFDTIDLGEAFVDSIESILEFRNTTLQNVNTTAEALMIVENSGALTTNGAKFLSSDSLYFFVTGSTLTFTNSFFQNDMNLTLRAAFFEECNVNLVGSTFSNLDYIASPGGAIDTLNSQVNINTCTFENNRATDGGAIAFRCEEGNTCTYNITGNTFRNNTALANGGAMHYDFYRPNISGNIYISNVALYGPDLAGFPVKIEIETLPTQIYVSGQQIEKLIQYKLIDHDGLTIATDSDSVITISPVQSTDKVIGNTDVTVNNGVATFKDVTFISKPGAKAVSYTVSSSNINEAKISTAFGMTLLETIQTLTLDFRECIVGEEQNNDMCTPCPTGKYSLKAGSAECQICPKHSTCLGKDQIEVDAGYWRSDFSSDVIHQCLNTNACLQYSFKDGLKVPYKCKKGYSNNLCQACIKIDGQQFQRTGDNQCGICPDIVLNGFRLFGLLLLLIIFVIIIIWSNIKTQKDSESAILIRILTNYFQIVTSAASFNLTFPRSLNSFFDGVKAVGESAKIFLSVDCFVQNVPMVKDTGTTEYFKSFMTGLSPFIFVGITVLVWFAIKVFMSYNWIQLKNRIIISICIVLFLLHPSITGMSLGLFNCFEIDNRQFWLFKDLSIRCWKGDHPKYAFGLGVPMVIFWVIGLPVLGFIIVRHYKNRLDEEFVIFRYRILFQGYKREAYYWEFVNVFRKVSIVMINTFLGIYPPIYKTFVATLTLAIILRQQEQIQPYLIKIMNEVEFRESTASIVTLFGGMFFILQNLPGVIKILLVIVIFATNLWFYSLWLHMFFKRSRFSSMRLLALFFGKISCLGSEYWVEELKTMQSNHDMDFVFGKYDAKDTKYNKVEEESKDQSFQGYAQGDNIINDLSAGDTGSLKGKEKGHVKGVDDDLKKTKKGKVGKEDPDAPKKGHKKKKKRIIRKKKGKKGAKKVDDDQDEAQEEINEHDEVEEAINDELDNMEDEIPDDDLEPEEVEKPKKKVRRKKKKTARKNDKVDVYPEENPGHRSKSHERDPDDFSADEEADEI